MKNFFWNIFMKSGSVEAFLGYKEFETAARDKKTRPLSPVTEFKGEA